ncbi:MAG: hypothetical protein AAB519_02190 [Patescibacteria group bacterium]
MERFLKNLVFRLSEQKGLYLSFFCSDKRTRVYNHQLWDTGAFVMQTTSLTPTTSLPILNKDGSGISVTSLGFSGKGYLHALREKGVKLTEWAIDVLESEEFDQQRKPWHTWNLKVIFARQFEERQRTDLVINTFARASGHAFLNVEAAVLFRLRFSDAELHALGLDDWVLLMHIPIPTGNPRTDAVCNQFMLNPADHDHELDARVITPSIRIWSATTALVYQEPEDAPS